MKSFCEHVGGHSPSRAAGWRVQRWTWRSKRPTHTPRVPGVPGRWGTRAAEPYFYHQLSSPAPLASRHRSAAGAQPSGHPASCSPPAPHGDWGHCRLRWDCPTALCWPSTLRSHGAVGGRERARRTGHLSTSGVPAICARLPRKV